MKPFIIGDKRFAFDVTNADDLRRLERAFDRFAAYLHGCIEEEARCDRVMRQIYLGEADTVGDGADASAAQTGGTTESL